MQFLQLQYVWHVALQYKLKNESFILLEVILIPTLCAISRYLSAAIRTTTKSNIFKMGQSKYFENGTIKIIICSFVACLSIVSSGSVISYPSPAVPNLNSNRNPYYVDSEEESWIGGLVPLGAVLGGAVCGVLMDYLGRKLTLMVSAIPYAIGWVLVVASQNVGMMYAGRLICGTSLGMASGVAHVYVAETSPANLRGSLCSLGEAFFSIGMVYVYSFGYFLNWQWLAVSCIIVVLINITGVYFLPETPRWLLIQAQTDKAKAEEAAEVLRWLRGSKTNIEKELKEIETSVIETSKVGPWKDFLRKEHMQCSAAIMWKYKH